MRIVLNNEATYFDNSFVAYEYLHSFNTENMFCNELE
jgi:hypothetical protein